MYTTISLQCIDQTLQPTNLPRITSGGKKEVRVEFSFDALWNGLGKTAIFYRDKSLVYHALLQDDACMIPWAVMMEPGRLYIGVYGANGETVRTSEVLPMIVEQGAVAAASSMEPTPNIYQQILAAYGAVERDVALDSARIDNLLAGETVDGEVIDLRVGADGKTYTSAGEAVRAQFKDVRLAPQYTDFWYLGEEFYAEPGENYTIYLKFDTITQRVPTAAGHHTWEEIMAEVGESSFEASPNGVENCLKLNYFDALVYDPAANTFMVMQRPLNGVEYDYVTVAFNAWGRLENCLLANMLAGYYVKDLQKIAEHTEALENMGMVTPDYWKSTLAGLIQKVHTYQNNGGVDSASFAIITDVHNGENMAIASHLLKQVTDACDIVNVFNCGDMVSGAGKCTKEALIEELANVKDAFRANSTMLYLEGNHDAAYDETMTSGVYYQQNLTAGESYNHIHRVNKRQRVTFGADGTYYFVDDELAKVRYICLNTSDLVPNTNTSVLEDSANKMRTAAIRQEQMDFVAEALKSADGYAVVVLSHIPLVRDGVTGSDMTVYNSDVLLSMLAAVKNGEAFTASSADTVPSDYALTVSADFTGVAVDIVGCFAGHVHYDNSKTVNDIPIITTLNNSMDVYSTAPAKTMGTTYECAFDIATIDKSRRQVQLVRIGADWKVTRIFRY